MFPQERSQRPPQEHRSFFSTSGNITTRKAFIIFLLGLGITMKIAGLIIIVVDDELAAGITLITLGTCFTIGASSMARKMFSQQCNQEEGTEAREEGYTNFSPQGIPPEEGYTSRYPQQLLFQYPPSTHSYHHAVPEQGLPDAIQPPQYSTLGSFNPPPHRTPINDGLSQPNNQETYSPQLRHPESSYTVRSTPQSCSLPQDYLDLPPPYQSLQITQENAAGVAPVSSEKN